MMLFHAAETNPSQTPPCVREFPEAVQVAHRSCPKPPGYAMQDWFSTESNRRRMYKYVNKQTYLKQITFPNQEQDPYRFHGRGCMFNGGSNLQRKSPPCNPYIGSLRSLPTWRKITTTQRTCDSKCVKTWNGIAERENESGEEVRNPEV